MADTIVGSNRVRQQHHETFEVATSRMRAHLTSCRGSRREHGAGSSSPANADTLHLRN